MSRIGKKPVPLPNGVKALLKGSELWVEGPKGKLSFKPHTAVQVNCETKQVAILCTSQEREARSVFGLTRTLIANMVQGVSQGFTKELEINGVGYKAEVKGKVLAMSLGFSHQVDFPLPDGVSAVVEKNKITLSSIDKQLLGATAAKIRSFRPPEPYKGKGVKYAAETILRKEGKSGSKK